MAAPNYETPLVADYQVMIDGAPLPVDVNTCVTSVVVDNDVSLPGMFEVELVASDHQPDPLSWIDDETLFVVGGVVDVQMGYIGDLESLLIGEITGLEPTFATAHPPSLIVRGYDRRHRLHRGRKTRTFVQEKDSDIVAHIASEAGLSPVVEDTQVVHDYVLQRNQTDMEFLHERARRLNYEVMVDDRDLVFRPVANNESEILTLSMDDDLLDLSLRLSAVQQVSEVTLRGWDPKEKQEIQARAGAGDETTKMGGQQSGTDLVEGAFGAATAMTSHLPVMNQAEADQYVKARFNDIGSRLIVGEGISAGRTDLRPGRVIKLDGIGERFRGQYYVTSAMHRFGQQQGYQTHFSLQRSAL